VRNPCGVTIDDGLGTGMLGGFSYGGVLLDVDVTVVCGDALTSVDGINGVNGVGVGTGVVFFLRRRYAATTSIMITTTTPTATNIHTRGDISIRIIERIA
jgi:hypothetical protein